jgi:dienelactone hydrolase
MSRLVRVALFTVMLAGCATSGPGRLAPGEVRFTNATPGAPRVMSATELKPDGSGPFPAVVLLHGCHGVSPSTHDWGRWFRDRGYVALIVDSWTARGLRKGLCTPASPDVPNTERFDDTLGALAYLHTRAYVDADRVGIMGWSNGGVFAMAAVNGPTHERAARRGLRVPPPGFRAAVAMYPGGCASLIPEKVVRPLLVLLGGADDWTIPKKCIDMVGAMRSRGADVTLVVYPGAYHYFDVEGQAKAFLSDVENENLPGHCCGATVGYEAAAAADARRRVEEFFGYHLRRP